ncbi:MAG: hypothetical protein JEZ00_16055 [Anaerolineaceae bacterium]|nr:hypothetical protein [Anaerolineaceae bacterium]
MRLVCEYCQSSNPNNEKDCIACGAPLPKVKKKSVPKKNINKNSSLLKKEDKSVELATQAARLYSSIWLAIFDAIIIAAVSFTLGLAGGVFNQTVLGVLGAAALGISVGLTVKGGILTLISAPLGLLIGSFLCIAAMIFHLPPFVYMLLLSICTCLAAMLGGHKSPYKYRTIWYKIRPFLGMAGGILFGVIGMGIGLGLQVVYTNFLQFLQELL